MAESTGAGCAGVMLTGLDEQIHTLCARNDWSQTVGCICAYCGALAWLLKLSMWQLKSSALTAGDCISGAAAHVQPLLAASVGQ